MMKFTNSPLLMVQTNKGLSDLKQTQNFDTSKAKIANVHTASHD